MTILIRGGRQCWSTSWRQIRTFASATNLPAGMSHLPPGYKDHTQRTDGEPREEEIHDVILKKVEIVNENIRLLKLATPEGWHPSSASAAAKEARPYIRFLPGQWLDVFTPASPKPGGFTIASPPALAKPLSTRAQFKNGYVELAVQNSAKNPPAAYFFQPVEKIIGSALSVRVGGSFHWPHDPPSISIKDVKRYVFIAGGVGINPLMSIVSHLDSIQGLSSKYDVRFLYSTKAPFTGQENGQLDLEGSGGEMDGKQILFLERLAEIFEGKKGGIYNGQLQLFLTGTSGYFASGGRIQAGERSLEYTGRRIGKSDVEEALGPVADRARTVVYACGIPTMTDEVVKIAKEAEGMDENNVLCEKWW